ncbi:MAG: hypothetical protein V4466_11480 [Pseudomonadota bacterium]
MSLADPLAPADPLEIATPPERVNYALGVLLDAQDFKDEQTYHRGRLAAALKHLMGFGTVAGLRVGPPTATDPDMELRVDPGLAIDRHGRLVQVTEPQCIRLARWFAAQSTGDLRAAIQRTPRVGVDVAVVFDVFLSADACARGKTPAFANGPFDALDAVVPSRLADASRLTLVPRKEGPPDPIPAPENFWPAPDASRDDLLKAVLGSWESAPATADESLEGMQEHVEGFDASAVLLARVAIPVTFAKDAAEGVRPQLKLTERVTVDNSLRPFIVLPGKWLGRAYPDRDLIEP